MKKILFLAGRYYPKASPNSICIRNIIDSLPKEEYEVSIICYKDGLDEIDSRRVYKISRGVIQSVLYKLENSQSASSKKMMSVFNYLSKVKQVPFYPVWPWTDPIFTLKEYITARKLHKVEHFDIIVSAYVPLSSVIVGHALKRFDPDVMFVAYFLDSLTGGAVPRFIKPEKFEKKAKKWERILLGNADRIIFMNASRQHHDDIYSKSSLYSRITYLDLPVLRKTQPYEKTDDQALIVYVGSLTPSVRSPEYFLKVFSLVPDPTWKLLFVGDNSCAILNEYARRDKRITVLGRCSHKEALAYEQRATVLLNIGNNNPNLTPSKVLEYISFGKKIVSTYPIDNESSLSYLRKYPLACLLDERCPECDAAKALSEFVSLPTKGIQYPSLKQMYYMNTPEAFIQIISSKK